MSPVPANNREPDKQQQDQEVGSVDTPQFVVANSDSDSEGEDDGYSGYQLLPQDPDTVMENEEDEGEEAPHSINQLIMHSLDDQDMMEAASAQKQETHVQSESSVSERAEIWNTPVVTEPTVPMDQEQISRIRSAMSGFNLPATAQPSWARNVPEADWKQQLLCNIKKGVPITTVNPVRPDLIETKNPGSNRQNP